MPESRFAAEYVFELYSETELLSRTAAHAHQCMIGGDLAGARDALVGLRQRYGDLFGLRMRIDDAIKALSDD